ncbi:MAG: hypothetical protein F8N15_00380 [Methanobacterium sp.]|nr:hypothetical protein [Methanobacterium sp.]
MSAFVRHAMSVGELGETTSRLFARIVPARAGKQNRSYAMTRTEFNRRRMFEFESAVRALADNVNRDPDEIAASLRKLAAQYDDQDFLAGPVCPGER